MFMCYSRELGEKKEYTTDKLLSKRVSRMLSPVLGEKNTHIFICGSANMAEECKDALREIVQNSFDAIIEEGRLHCDVFGALSSKKKKNDTMKRNTSYTFGDLLQDEDFDDDLDLGNLALSLPVVGQGLSRRDLGLGRRGLTSSCIMLGSAGRASSVGTGLGPRMVDLNDLLDGL